jgi:hypothetical protein
VVPFCRLLDGETLRSTVPQWDGTSRLLMPQLEEHEADMDASAAGQTLVGVLHSAGMENAGMPVIYPTGG